MRPRLTKAFIWRLLTVFACSTGAMLGLLYLSYYLYWRILYRTQTSEFNLLSDLLPTKLSIYLIKGDGRSLQQTIDRNQGRFGIVVTDCASTAVHCPNQQILYASQAQVKLTGGQTQLLPQPSASATWLDRLQTSPEALSGEFFLPLRFPYPLYPDWPYQTSLVYPPAQSANSGRIIGRVYLIRSPQPAFGTDLQQWLQAPTRTDRAWLYSTIATATVCTAGFMGLGVELALRRLQQFQARINQDQLKTIAARHAVEAERDAILGQLDAAIAAKDEALIENEERELTTAGFIEAAELAWQQQEAAEAAAEVARQEAQRLATAIAIAQAENAELETRLAQLETAQAENAELETRLAQLAIAQAENADLAVRLEQSIAAQAQATQEKIALEGQLQENQTQIDYLNLLVDAIDEEERLLKAQQQELAANYHKAEAEIQQLKAEIEQLQAKSNLKILMLRTAADALTAAAVQFPILEVWASARSSARKISLRHYSPEKVYKNLQVLAEVGTAFLQNSLTTDLDDSFKNKGVQYSPHESPGTMAKYGDRRLFRQGNQTKQMVRHLKVGRKLRIYFDFDREQQKVQIGYCGNHLPTIQE